MAVEKSGNESIQNMELDAGWLCLDFANTSNWHASEQPIEYLTSYADLVVWGKRTGLLSEAAGQRLLAQAKKRPAAAEAVLKDAIALRDAIYEIFTELSHDHAPDDDDLAVLNRHLAASLAHARLAAQAGGFAWAWEADDDALDRMLWPVARSTADLLTSDQVDRVGQCADDRGCGWLFFDTTRNHSRRWCDMKDCGNRAKAQRHYRRQRAARAFSAA